ncbi:disease resistance protein RPV1 isoform X1 [Cryptomeria japonica]|uniref:disease resistance protein RPV1 isoform X1 n=1 Tax=Cryptomeria japonica TaxID=3369 RepID=UPI0027DA4042|nr:disease resistance protein RPV1 isoform X1 [Cryptomeria japonica]
MGEVSRELLWLRWFQIGQKNLPSQLSLKKLRVLEFYEGESGEHHLEELWSDIDGVAPVHLRELVISKCYEFQAFPNSIGRLNHLKKIVIIKGYKVSSLPEEFCLLQSLEHLVLYRCKILSSLPSNFGNLRNLRHLSLYDCGKLRKLPVSFKNLTLLDHLNLGGCSQLIFTTEDLNILENMTKLEFFRVSECEQLEDLPHHITNQASLRELYLNGTIVRKLPVNIGQFSRLTEMRIGSLFLTSLPTSLGDLCSLTTLSIWGCPKLECLPDSVGRLNLLKELDIQYVGVRSLPKSVTQLNNLQTLIISNCPINELDFGAASLPFGLSNLKMIFFEETEVCRVSISEDCCPCLETLILQNHHHLKEIEALPKTIQSISMINCEMLKNIPSFAQLTSLEGFTLGGCYQVEKIEGLENCTRLQTLRVDTCWEVPGIESLEHMEQLTRVKLTTNRGSAIERCIQTIQKWPDEIEICTRAVPDAASLINSLLSPNNLVVIDSISNQKIESTPKLLQKHSCNGDAIMLCFVINCVSAEMAIWASHNGSGYCYKLYEGRWVWIGFFTQRSSSTWFTAEEFSVEGSGGDCKEEDQVEKGVIVKGEEHTLVEAFRSLMTILYS